MTFDRRQIETVLDSKGRKVGEIELITAWDGVSFWVKRFANPRYPDADRLIDEVVALKSV